MNEEVIIKKGSERQEIKFNKEYPFVKIHHVKIDNINPNENYNSHIEDFIKALRISIIDLNGNHQIDSFINYTQRFDFHKKINGNVILLNSIILNPDHHHLKIELFVEEFKFNENEFIISYTNFNQSISLKTSSNNFDNHFRLNNNIKIFFSAPFGQGKTTFLDYYFTNSSDRFEVFKLYPVNYSVSHNEDIFRYVKSEILFQLIEKGAEFDKINFTILESLPFYILNSPGKILQPLIKYLAAFSYNADKVLEELFKVIELIKDHNKNSNIDQKEGVKDYIKELYEKEGSIYEDNIYSQIIIQQLELLKKKNHKDNVLLIDDLDRLDPDHLFRILNVFAAHFDSPDYKNTISNKFNFDKIILIGRV